MMQIAVPFVSWPARCTMGHAPCCSGVIAAFIRLLIVVPVPSLLDRSAMLNFHRFLGSSNRDCSRRRCSSLLICKNTLTTVVATLGQDVLELVNPVEPRLPFFLGHEAVDADHQHVFVVRAIEDADKAPARRGSG